MKSVYKQEIKMNLSSSARKAVAAGLAVSTLVWSMALVILPTVFAAPHSSGCLVNASGTVWLIENGMRKGFTSAEVFTSHGYNFSQVVGANAEDTALPVGSIIVYADGSLVKGPSDPLVYLVANGQKRGFVSGSVFTGLGFSFANIQSAAVNTFADLPTGANLESATERHTTGVLVKDGTGTVWKMTANGRMGIPSMEVFNSYGYKWDHIVTANAADLAAANEGVVTARPGCSDTVVIGNVSVSLASNNPASGTIVQNQSTADLAHFNFNGSGTVASITLQRIGVSNNSVFDNVYLYEGNTRISDPASVNSTGVITFNGLNWAVNGSRTVSVRADIAAAATAGQTTGVALTGFTLSGASSASANVSGNLFTVVASTGILGTVNVGTNTSLGTTVDAGATQATFWGAPVTVGTHSMWLKSLSLRYVGSAPNDALTNVKLYIDGTPVATSTGINSLSNVVFDFGSNPFSLSTGSHSFDVRADVQKGSSRTVQLSLQNKADFMATDSQANINVGVSSPTAGGFAANSGAVVTINTGTVSVSVDPGFLSLTNVTGGATNAVIAKYKLHAYGEDVKVNTLVVTPTLAAQSAVAAAGLNNVTLYFNGAQIGSSQNMTAATTQALSFTLGSSLIIPAGVDSFLEVRADLTTFSTNLNYTDGTVQVTLPIAVDNSQGMNSFVSTIDVPSAAQAANALTIQTGVVAIAANPNFAAQSVSPNSANQKIGSYIIQNQSSSEGVRVTNLNIGLVLTTAGSTNYSNLKTSETSGAGAVPINPTAAAAAATSSNNFPVNFTLAPGETKTLDIFADVGSAAGSLTADLLITALGASSNVTLCSATISGGSVNGCNVGPGTRATGQTITVQTGTFANAGLVVSSSSAPQYIAAAGTGATDAVKATYNFKSTNGSATVSELKFRVTTSGAGLSASSVRIGSVTGTVVSGVAYLTGLNIAVPNGGAGINVDAFITYGPVGTNGNTSGVESFTEMVYIKYSIGGTTGTTTGGQTVLASNTLLTTQNAGNAPAAVGSSAVLTFVSTAAMQTGMMIVIDNVADTVGVVQSVDSTTTATVRTLFLGTADNAGTSVRFFSVPQIAPFASTVNNCPTLAVAGTTVAVGGTSGTDCMSLVGSKPTLGVTDSNSLLTNSSVKVGSVTVVADAKGDLAINALPITLSSTGATACTTCTVTVKNAADQSTLITTNTTLTYAGGASDETVVTFTGGYVVTAGQTVTLDIYVTPITTDADDSLTMTLTSQATFLWTDVAGNGTTAAETGALLTTYPTASSTIQNF